MASEEVSREPCADAHVTGVAGVWLAVMENIQKHAGYPQRSAIAACIAIQGLATVLCLVLDGRSIFRTLVLLTPA